jgi:hypothetical protein
MESRRASSFLEGIITLIQVTWFVLAQTCSIRPTRISFIEVRDPFKSLALISYSAIVSSVRSRYVRSAWYNGQRVEADNHQVFSLTDEKEHTKRRAQVAMGVRYAIQPKD